MVVCKRARVEFEDSDQQHYVRRNISSLRAERSIPNWIAIALAPRGDGTEEQL
jgi:hypothetical protein